MHAESADTVRGKVNVCNVKMCHPTSYVTTHHQCTCDRGVNPGRNQGVSLFLFSLPLPFPNPKARNWGCPATTDTNGLPPMICDTSLQRWEWKFASQYRRCDWMFPVSDSYHVAWRSGGRVEEGRSVSPRVLYSVNSLSIARAALYIHLPGPGAGVKN